MDLNNNKLSSVIVLHELSSDSLILTKRSEQMRHHPGEICFPGGIWEEGDKDLYATALRELYEELAIGPERINLVKELKVQQTALGTIIHPWLATINSVTPYELNQTEVSELIAIPMSLVVKQENYSDYLVERSGMQFMSCRFTPYANLLWGATAKIMKQLIL